ncbi:hypothetical protein MTR67_030343 [Solanum verrucosum]|uniref:Uncharacterized protein n=1 Tax=Solanum verrucosum TaxID=315347 RepID=A0AAF0R954_SOLVR|nr:hypothetical protein MTR67_030343 [Solanum verrucosum]
MKNKHPISRIDDLCDQLQEASLFSNIDLRFGYHHLKIRASDDPTTTFQTQYGHFEFLLMNEEDNDQQLRIVLQRLREEKLYAKFSKFEFWVDSVAFVGHVVSKEGIQVDIAKIEEIRGWTRLTSV